MGKSRIICNITQYTIHSEKKGTETVPLHPCNDVGGDTKSETKTNISFLLFRVEESDIQMFILSNFQTFVSPKPNFYKHL